MLQLVLLEDLVLHQRLHEAHLQVLEVALTHLLLPFLLLQSLVEGDDVVDFLAAELRQIPFLGIFTQQFLQGLRGGTAEDMGEQGVLPEAAPEGSQEILHHLLDPPAELCYFLVDELPVEELVLGFDVPEGVKELLGSDVGMGFFGGQMLFAMVFTVGGFLGAFDGFAELGDDAVVGVAEDEELVGVEVLEVVGVVLEVHLYD